MTCETMARYLDLYLDHELAVQESAEVETHLAGCETCRRAATLETRFRGTVREALCSERAPRSLHDQVILRLRAEHMETRARWVPRLAWAAGLAALAAGVWLVVGSPINVPDPADRLVADHEAASGTEIYGDATRVASFLKERSPFATRIPIADREGFRLIGARIAKWDDTPAVVYLYDMNGKRVSVAQYPSSAAKSPSRLRVDDRSGYVVATYQDGDLVQTMVGDMPPSVVPSVIPASK